MRQLPLPRGHRDRAGLEPGGARSRPGGRRPGREVPARGRPRAPRAAEPPLPRALARQQRGAGGARVVRDVGALGRRDRRGGAGRPAARGPHPVHRARRARRGRDAHGDGAGALKGAGQGSFTLEGGRSPLEPARCKGFPDNLELEALLTFAGEEPGPEVRATAPTPQAVTLAEHQALVRLPDAGYTPRAWDPRSGSFAVLFADYARPIAADIDVRWLVRHRLEKLDPHAARSRVKQPIVYYVDPGAPEPIRSALVEGASWWARAFEAAGFIDAFQVKLLPPGADPLDVRYNVVEWVHRATRRWADGGGVGDPRTGEMLKGHVTLGSLRIRQDRLIFEGLAGAAKR